MWSEALQLQVSMLLCLRDFYQARWPFYRPQKVGWKFQALNILHQEQNSRLTWCINTPTLFPLSWDNSETCVWYLFPEFLHKVWWLTLIIHPYGCLFFSLSIPYSFSRIHTSPNKLFALKFLFQIIFIGWIQSQTQTNDLILKVSAEYHLLLRLSRQ